MFDYISQSLTTKLNGHEHQMKNNSKWLYLFDLLKVLDVLIEIENGLVFMVDG